MATRIAKLYDKVEFFNPIRVSDGIGGFTTQFNTMGLFWVNVEELPINKLTVEYHYEGISFIKVTMRKPFGFPLSIDTTLLYENQDYKVVTSYQHKDKPKEFIVIEAVAQGH